MARLGSTAGAQPDDTTTTDPGGDLASIPGAGDQQAPAHPAGDDGNDKLLSLTGFDDKLTVQVQVDGETETTSYELTRTGAGTRVPGKHVSAVRKAADSLGKKLRSSTPKD